jgi:hypothetical protein
MLIKKTHAWLLTQKPEITLGQETSSLYLSFNLWHFPPGIETCQSGITAIRKKTTMEHEEE